MLECEPVRKLYRVLLDPLAQKRGLLRVIDESGGDYLYPSGHFVAVELPAATAKLLAGQL